MRKKIISIIAAAVCLCSLSACDIDQTFDDSTPLININTCLYYDVSTHIVYFWNGASNSNAATTPSPYYAPNGLPYKYNPDTNTFEEIK